MNKTKDLNVKRSQTLFIYDSVYNNPNGDPMTNEPRMDFATDHPLISDVRIKRYIRDFLMFMNATGSDHEVYLREVDREELDKVVEKKKQKGISGSSAQIKVLAQKYGIEDAKELMCKCIDVRAFGGVSTAEGNTAQLTGPLQFENLNKALNRVALRPHQNTSVFQSDMDNKQGAIGTTVLVPFCLNQIVSQVNPFLALETGLTEDEVMIIYKALWDSINVCVSRSKTGQTPRILIKINLKNPAAKLADLSEKISILPPEGVDEVDLRSVSQITWDFSKLAKLIASDLVESVEYRVEESLEKVFLEQMSSVKKKLIAF